MYKSKRYSYSYEQVEDEGKNASTMVTDILADPQLPELEEIVIGCWGSAWDEEDGVQPLLDGIVEHKEAFSHVKSLFVGDMDYEDCEVSWIIQGDYSRLWTAMPQLERLVIKGSTGLELGTVEHANLKEFEIICGGLPKSVMKEVQTAKLPALEKLLLYIGMDDYGCDGDLSDIEALLSESDFPNLKYLGLTNSEFQDEIVEAVLDSKYIGQITMLDLSMGTLTDKGGQLLLDRIAEFSNITKLDLHYHYLSGRMMKKLKKLPCEVDVDEQNEADEYDGELYYYPMLGE